MSITIKESSKDITSWVKDITFEHMGKQYNVTLYWDSYDGYDITFKNKHNGTPDWAARWIEQDEYSENLLAILDEMTEKTGENNE
jgi:hypothetical protein